jgi:tetratricopeptide (TPR) repeat protein
VRPRISDPAAEQIGYIPTVLGLAFLTVGLSLSPSERRAFENAIESHRTSDFESAERSYRRILDAHSDFVPARLYLAELLWLAGAADAARKELSLARPKASELLLFRLLERTFGSGGDDELLGQLLSTAPLSRNRFLATGTPILALLSLGRVEDAIVDYRRVSALDPSDIVLHQELGAAFLRAKLFLPAADAFERVVSLAPDDPSSWSRLGVAHLSLLRWSSAISDFENAIRTGGDNPSVILALGYAYERTPDYEGALELYRKASRLAPASGRPHFRIGRVLLALGRIDDAQLALSRATELEPTFAEAYRFLGEIHVKRGRYDDAVQALEKSVSLDPESMEAYYVLAQAYRRSRREEEARKAFARYTELKREQRPVASQEEVLARTRRNRQR